MVQKATFAAPILSPILNWQSKTVAPDFLTQFIFFLSIVLNIHEIFVAGR